MFLKGRRGLNFIPFGACLSLSVLCAGQAFSCFQLSLVSIYIATIVPNLSDKVI
jgi:hypothetical protein